MLRISKDKDARFFWVMLAPLVFLATFVTILANFPVRQPFWCTWRLCDGIVLTQIRTVLVSHICCQTEKMSANQSTEPDSQTTTKFLSSDEQQQSENFCFYNSSDVAPCFLCVFGVLLNVGQQYGFSVSVCQRASITRTLAQHLSLNLSLGEPELCFYEPPFPPFLSTWLLLNQWMLG